MPTRAQSHHGGHTGQAGPKRLFHGIETCSCSSMSSLTDEQRRACWLCISCPRDRHVTSREVRFHTLPPSFMPITALESAGGAFGPPPPANSPFALSLIFLPALLTVAPAVNSNGCIPCTEGETISCQQCLCRHLQLLTKSCRFCKQDKRSRHCGSYWGRQNLQGFDLQVTCTDCMQLVKALFCSSRNF